MRTWRLKFASYKTPDDIFNTILDGSKSIETRPAKAPGSKKNYAEIVPGDKLLFCSVDTGREITKVVTFVHPYKTITEMLNNEDFKKIFPQSDSKEELIKLYEQLKNKWGKKYKFELEHYGIIALGFA